MLNTITQLTDATVSATDGDIGHIASAFFDDQTWTIRYLVVDAGSWLTDRQVLISPYSVNAPQGSASHISVSLNREQVKHSPDIDTHQPVSRQHERDFLGYYAYPLYWGGDGLWGVGGLPTVPPAIPDTVRQEVHSALHRRDVQAGDVHLRSSAHVTGYDIQASDESIGHVQDFVYDEATWSIRYLVVDTRNWWPGGRKVLISVQWIEAIDWATRQVRVSLTREQVKASPEFGGVETIQREYEQRLHEAYKRPGYWADEVAQAQVTAVLR